MYIVWKLQTRNISYKEIYQNNILNRDRFILRTNELLKEFYFYTSNPGGEIKMKDKLKNPYFWLSTFALIFSASGVDFNQLTSWSLLAEALVGILANPVAIIAIITAFLGIWNDNSTKGLDKPTIKK